MSEDTPAQALAESLLDSHATPGSGRHDSFRDQVLGISGYVGALRRGPRAELRRVEADPDHIPPQVFWDIVERYGIRERDESFWLSILPLMVRYPHRFDLSPGRALAAAGVSPARIERWLRLDRDGARRQAGRLLSHLKDGGLDWIRFAYLLRGWSDEQRRGFARDFFLSPEYRKRQAGDDA
ncbi:MAG TPA: type I-E CRISPR-associated protein Cse2/CasB [Longimicrobiaceae bacterium]|nr:type I-E CRISPR-associated protein Cse2/CasB [Longimicrobiaceae bacterium]